MKQCQRCGAPYAGTNCPNCGIQATNKPTDHSVGSPTDEELRLEAEALYPENGEFVGINSESWINRYNEKQRSAQRGYLAAAKRYTREQGGEFKDEGLKILLDEVANYSPELAGKLAQRVK